MGSITGSGAAGRAAPKITGQSSAFACGAPTSAEKSASLFDSILKATRIVKVPLEEAIKKTGRISRLGPPLVYVFLGLKLRRLYFELFHSRVWRTYLIPEFSELSRQGGDQRLGGLQLHLQRAQLVLLRFLALSRQRDSAQAREPLQVLILDNIYPCSLFFQGFIEFMGLSCLV